MVENEPPEVGEKITKRINIFLLGNNEVGKTSFISRYLYDKFEIKYIPTISLNSDFTPKSIIIEDILYLIIFFDPTGKKSSIQHLTQFIKKSDGFIIMYDITNKESFDAIPDWIKIVTDVKEKPNIAMILLGNKRDIKHERQIEEKDAEEFAKKMEVLFLETSNKDNNDDNIHLAVEKLVNDIEEKRKKFGFEQDLNSEKTRVSLNKEKKSKKKNFWYSCC